MREIKFRAKDGQGMWRYGSLWHELGEWFIYENSDYKIQADTIGQLTGLKDKNGKEIYEGDFVIVGTKYPKNKTPQIVGWDKEQARWCFVYDTGEPLRDFHLRTEIPLFEVIGNIYENPDLLANK